MSSVAEISALAHEAADYAAPSTNWKDRVHAAARVFDLSFGRAKRLYFKEARRVDAEEMDNAREKVRALRDQRERQKAAEHLAWLECELGRLRASGEEFHGPHVDGLEHFLRMARNQASPVAVQAKTEAD